MSTTTLTLVVCYTELSMGWFFPRGKKMLDALLADEGLQGTVEVIPWHVFNDGTPTLPQEIIYKRPTIFVIYPEHAKERDAMRRFSRRLPWRRHGIRVVTFGFRSPSRMKTAIQVAMLGIGVAIHRRIEVAEAS